MIPQFELDELETPRLKLRKLAFADAAQLVLLRSDERVNRYLDRPASTTHEEALQFISKILAANSYYWALTLQNETALIGTMCLWNAHREKSVVEIGYELLPAYHGKGLMTEALQAVIAYNSTVLQFETIIATLHIENIPSIKLLEKNGFIRDKTGEDQLHKEGGPGCEVVYSLKAK